jgi:hypothetical protein
VFLTIYSLTGLSSEYRELMRVVPVCVTGERLKTVRLWIRIGRKLGELLNQAIRNRTEAPVFQSPSKGHTRQFTVAGLGREGGRALGVVRFDRGGVSGMAT